MSSFAEKKAAALKAARPHKDVPVWLDTGVAAECDALEASKQALLLERDRLANPSDQRMSAPVDTTAVDAKIAAVDKKLTKLRKQEHDAAVTVRLYKVSPPVWADLTATHPARAGVEFDDVFGCDMRAVCRAAAVDDARIIDGADELVQSADEWAEFWPLIGPGFNAVMDATFELNVTEPALRLARLKNFSEAATASAKK